MQQAEFQRLRPSEIREFRFQIRDYQPIEFRNVALQPGKQTNVEIWIDGKRFVPGVAELPLENGREAQPPLKFR